MHHAIRELRSAAEAGRGGKRMRIVCDCGDFVSPWAKTWAAAMDRFAQHLRQDFEERARLRPRFVSR